MRTNVAAGRLRFTTSVLEAVAFGHIQFIAVGTPPEEGGSADVQYVLAAARSIGRPMVEEKLGVIKGTVPVDRHPEQYREAYVQRHQRASKVCQIRLRRRHQERHPAAQRCYGSSWT